MKNTGETKGNKKLNYPELRKKFKKFLKGIDQKEFDIWLKKQRSSE